MTGTGWFRVAMIGLGVALALYAGAVSFAQATRPAFHASDFFGNAPRATAADSPLSEMAATISVTADVRADYAALKARQAIETPANNPADRQSANMAAERALVSTLTVSPIRSMTWLILSTLKGKMGEPTAGTLKMSYLTGPIPSAAAFSRIRTVTTTPAVSDEDIRLLAQSDVRGFLMRRPRLDSELVAVYVQATPEGKKFLLDATQAIDPKFSALLHQY